MAVTNAVALSPEEMPLPMGVQAESGKTLPGLTPEDVRGIQDSLETVPERGSSDNTDFLAIADVDPNKLEESGWGIVFSQNVDPAVRTALQPLIDHRRRQVNNDRLFKIFEGASGFQPTDTVRSWLARFRVGFAVVDPLAGVPLYLLIVGSPEDIPYEFQYLLDTYWSVGRLHFDSPTECRAYVEAVIAYETAATVPQRKRVAVFSARNLGDRATALLMDQVTTPLVHGSETTRPLGESQGFVRQPFLGDAATKENLVALLRGQVPGGAPAVLFSGSHGISFALDDPAQREKQGAILCTDWSGGPVQPEHYFAAADLPADAQVNGLIHFFFACYGGGCPKFDTYSRLPDGKPKQIASAPMVARLPQMLLARGALAVIAHIDRAWSYSFQVARAAPQVQEFRDVMVRAMKGDRVGACTDQFNLRWAVLSAELADLKRQRTTLPGQVSDAALGNGWVARDDARNYITLGDPAVRLRVEAMSA